jgi:hypothetical protein
VNESAALCPADWGGGPPLNKWYCLILLVQFLLWLPADEREKVIDLLKAIQDRRWHEVWPEPIIVGGAQE